MGLTRQLCFQHTPGGTAPWERRERAACQESVSSDIRQVGVLVLQPVRRACLPRVAGG